MKQNPFNSPFGTELTAHKEGRWWMIVQDGKIVARRRNRAGAQRKIKSVYAAFKRRQEKKRGGPVLNS